ncbi:MAG: GntR family transcriptional regulator [Clostridiales bacterium]|nr:GntR family transcriptional regulator [Clostridiales bacterium]
MDKENYVEKQLVDAIFSGVYKFGDKLEPERELAKIFKCSRPVIHRAIIRLEEKGLVKIRPRKGVVVQDYKRSGKLSLLEHIISKNKDGISRKLNHDMLMFIRDNLISLVGHFKTFDKKHNHIEFTQRRDYFDFLIDYAIQTNNIVNVLLLNEFEIGILNVTDSILENTDIRNQFLLLEELVVKRKIKEAISVIDETFEMIEYVWIGGEDDV